MSILLDEFSILFEKEAIFNEKLISEEVPMSFEGKATLFSEKPTLLIEYLMVSELEMKLFKRVPMLFGGETIFGEETIFEGETTLFEGETILFEGERILFEGETMLFDGETILYEEETML